MCKNIEFKRYPDDSVAIHKETSPNISISKASMLMGAESGVSKYIGHIRHPADCGILYYRYKP